MNALFRFTFGILAFIIVVIAGAHLLINSKPTNGNAYLLAVLLTASIGYVLRAYR